MGYLFHILCAVAIQALGEADQVLGAQAPWAVLLLLPLPHLLGLLARRAALRGRFAAAELLARVVQHSPPLLHLLAVVLFGWVASARAWTGSELTLLSWPQPALLFALSPFVVFELLAIDAHARVHGLRPVETRSVRNFHARMFLSSLAPLLVYVLVASLVGWREEVRVAVERVALWNAAFILLLLVLLALGLPALLRNTWETVPLGEGPQRALLEAVATRARFQARDLLVWRTGNMMANAAIVGLWPRTRVVLFSDSLLSMLGLRELAAVFAHEIGHAARHHVLIFLAWAVAFFLGGELLISRVLESGWPEGVDGHWVAITLAAGLFGMWYVGFGWLSRRCELEADLYSLELLGDPGAMVAALERVGGRLRDVAGWRHFSTAERVAFIERAARDEPFQRRFRRGIRVWAGVGGLLALATAGLELGELVRSYGPDRLRADLSLGRYARAAERAETLGERVEPGLASLAREAERLRRERGGELERAALELELRAAAGRGDWPAVWTASELIAFRGLDGFRGAYAFLEALEEGEQERALELLAWVEPDWRASLEGLLEHPLPEPQ